MNVIGRGRLNALFSFSCFFLSHRLLPHLQPPFLTSTEQTSLPQSPPFRSPLSKTEVRFQGAQSAMRRKPSVAPYLSPPTEA